MKKYILLITLAVMQFAALAQTDIKNTMVLLQECLNLNANSQQDVIKLYEQIGVVEYTLANFQQRVKLAELQKVEVKPESAGFAVSIKCGDENRCISFIKNDTSNTPITNTSIHFSDAALANTFAENLSALIMHYKTDEPALEKTLHKNDQGKVPLLGVKRAPDQKDAGLKPPPAAPKNAEATTDDEEPELKTAGSEKPSKEEKADVREEKMDEAKQKAAEKKETRAEQNEAKRQARKDKKAEAAEAAADNEQTDAGDKPTTRPKRKSSKETKADEAETGNEDEVDEKKTSRQKSKTSGNKLIEDVGEQGTGEEKTKAGNDFCAQLLNILQSGKESKFKSIEGKLTNADSKINDSKVKLKGARKNYLSWFQKERAFISELKSGNDYEVVLKEFENLQTQLDECLGGSWDMEDKSNSEEYAKLKTEVRDVEFKHNSDAAMPAVRVIFLENSEKFTMFMRVK